MTVPSIIITPPTGTPLELSEETSTGTPLELSEETSTTSIAPTAANEPISSIVDNASVEQAPKFSTELNQSKPDPDDDLRFPVPEAIDADDTNPTSTDTVPVYDRGFPWSAAWERELADPEYQRRHRYRWRGRLHAEPVPNDSSWWVPGVVGFPPEPVWVLQDKCEWKMYLTGESCLGGWCHPEGCEAKY